MKQLKISSVFLLLVVSILLCSCEKENSNLYDPSKFTFFDERAWVYEEKLEGFFTRRMNLISLSCIDTSGRVIFTIQDEPKYPSNFCNGYALYDTSYLIDTEGTIKNLAEDFGDLEIQRKPDDDYHFDGYIIVQKLINNVKMTGIIDSSNWTWHMNPTEKLNELTQDVHFLYTTKEDYYDMLLNEFISREEYLIRKVTRTFPDYGIMFFEQNESKPEHFYYKYKNSSGYVIMDKDNKTGYYDNDFNLVLDLSEYREVKHKAYSQKRKTALISFRTDYDKRRYVGLITMNGDFLFTELGTDYKNTKNSKISFEHGYYDFEGNYYANPETE